MPRRCPICDSPHRADIDQRIRLGESIRTLADAYGFEYHVLYHHARNHLGRDAPDLSANLDPDQLIVMLRDMMYELYDQAMARLQSGKQLQPATIRELRGLARDLLEIAGKLQPTADAGCAELERFLVEELPEALEALPDDRRNEILAKLGVEA